ncbi:transcription termination factor Rho [Gulosibacter sp. ACHW.36C]|uniref:Transcription termination factor Rho n=1 Tax=Gulosibacter sediminis TaxID=1729695 RepID=A0ABY4N379_9MICO|nr:transcription termination factor Rho [Gulosibacter sediminis]UQN15907.1 transcription termination factor Rho [Gulosibacter sediminis]
MTDSTTPNESRPLEQMRVADLQALAAQHGIKGAARMRKSVLIDAIQQAQAGETADATQAGAPAEAVTAPATEPNAVAEPAKDAAPADAAAVEQAPEAEAAPEPESAPATETAPEAPAQPATEQTKPAEGRGRRNRRASISGEAQQAEPKQNERKAPANDGAAKGDSPMTLDDIVLPPARDDEADSAEDEQQNEGHGRKRNRNRNRNNRQGDDAKQESGKQSGNNDSGQNAKSNQANQNSQGGNTNADRKRKRNRDDVDPEIAPDDVLLPIAGILDVLDNYAFVRTSGYLAGSNDVYVSLGQVKKYNLRKGDAIVGAIRQPREGEYQSGRQKYNALVKIDTVNGEQPDPARERADFEKLTALYPEERITLETSGGHAAQRMIDLFAPIGKGTRGLIVAPPKSGKSIMLERIANAIAQNSPDTHLMLVLVDERPEEVTRLERTIHGEVISSTFDMPAENHTTIAELAIERAKRLVELGLDVVVLLDSITQLGRAYNLTAPATGRIIAGGVDASALYPPKRFFGAARNVENGGSLTILATAMVETGSRTDEVILEEFAGTGNMELRLSREIANKRIFPALDIQQSSTLHEDQLLDADELEATWAIRRALGGDAQVSLEAVLERISQTTTNEEFLASVRANPISPVTAR